MMSEYNISDEFITYSPLLTGQSGEHPDSGSYVGRSNVMQIVFATLGMLGCPLNMFVVFIVLQSPAMRSKPFNILITHQAIIDGLVSKTEIIIHSEICT